MTYINFTSPPLADLKVTDPDVKGDGTDVNVTFFNQGTGDAVGVTVSLFDNSANKIREIIVDSVPTGTNYSYKFGGVNLSNVFVALDFANHIEESNESNNIASLIPANYPPILNFIGNKVVAENQLLSFSISATDADNDTLTYNATNLPASASFVGQTFSWTPSYTQNGSYAVTFTVTDNSSNSDSEIITITVADTNQVPAITSTPATTATRGLQYTYTMTATDVDGDTLTYAVNDSRFTQASNVFNWTAGETDYGTVNIMFNVSDGKNVTQQQATLSLIDDVYTVTAKTFDYDAASSNNFVGVDSTVTINSQTKSSPANIGANFTVNSNTAYDITHSATGYQSDIDYVYFDARLTTCTSGIDCTLSGTYTTICQWEAGYSNWYCSVEGGSLPKKTWFRYDRNQNIIKRANYLLK